MRPLPSEIGEHRTTDPYHGNTLAPPHGRVCCSGRGPQTRQRDGRPAVPEAAIHVKGAKPAQMIHDDTSITTLCVKDVPYLPPGQPGGAPAWHVLWTRSQCEQLVRDQLVAKGFQLFLPTLGTWTRRPGGRKARGCVPMFPGYLFLNHALDKRSDVEVRKARGLVAILGESWE